MTTQQQGPPESATITTGDDVMSLPTNESAIRAAVIAATTLGAPGLFHPGLDEGGMAVIWTTMVGTIAHRSGAQVSKATISKLIATAFSSVAAYSLGSKVLTWAAMPLLLAFPLAGVPAAVALNCALNSLFTYRLGRACVRRFSTPGFSAEDVIDVGRGLAGLPTLTEIGDLRRLMTND